MKMKKTLALFLAGLTVAASALLTSCSSSEPEDQTTAGAVLEKKATEIILSGSTASCDSSHVYMGEDGKISIQGAGTYLVSGTLDDGQIYVDCVDAGIVTLILKDANITNNDGACIYIKKTQEAVITLYEGTTNTLTDGTVYKFDNPEDNEPDAALFSKEDLIINGTGTLVVDGNYSNGIVSKDGLKIESGVIQVDAARHGIKGKDYLVIDGGTVTIDVEDNALNGYAISKSEACTVTISGAPYNG